MRVLKTSERKFILIIDFAIFTGVIIGFLLAISLTTNKTDIKKGTLNSIENISAFVVSDYSLEEDKNIANIRLKQNFKKQYDIEIFSAESAESAAQSVEASSLYDADAIYLVLNGIDECLLKYPKNIFSEIQNKGYDLSIYLVDNFNNNNIALATRDNNNKFDIYISNTNLLGKAVHHELYHILEYYMKLEFDINNLYQDWNQYNPIGFKYNLDTKKLDSKYVYNPNTKEKGQYFVTIYSKSIDKEDRAEVFADMMLSTSKPIYYDEGEMIGKKVKYISAILDKSFSSVKQSIEPIYWKRFV